VARLLLSIVVTLAACGTRGPQAFDQGAPGGDGGIFTGPVYERCRTHCVRPGDCEITYPNDERCPAGFRCAYLFSCTTDAGP
jgi:hypothetical protein